MIFWNNNLSIEGGAFSNENKIKLAINKEIRKSSGHKRFKDFRHSQSSLPNAVSLTTNLANTRNRQNNLYPYESHQLAMRDKKMKNNLRYDSFKRKYTIYSDSVIVNNNFGPKMANNYMMTSAKLSHSLEKD